MPRSLRALCLRRCIALWPFGAVSGGMAVLFGIAGLAATSVFAARQQTLPVPPSVAAFLDRREQCDHWAGEEPYDAARRRQIDRAITTLHCDRIEADDAVLRKRYRDNPAVLRALAAEPD